MKGASLSTLWGANTISLPQLGRDPISVALFQEESLNSPRIQFHQSLRPIEPGAGRFQRNAMHVGGKDLNVQGSSPHVHPLLDQHGQGVWLFAGGAARHPDAQLVVRAQPRQQLRQNLVFQTRKGLAIAKKSGHADQQVAVQGVQLRRVTLQSGQVSGQILRLADHHPALDTPLHRARLVVGKVDAEIAAQQLQDRVEVIAGLTGDGLSVVLFSRAIVVVREGFGHCLGCEHQVDNAGVDRAAWHPIEMSALGTLRDYQSADFMDLADTARAVAAGAGQDDADRSIAGVLRQRTKEGVDRQAKRLRGILVGQ